MRQNTRIRCWDKLEKKMLSSFPLYKACFFHNDHMCRFIVMFGLDKCDMDGKSIYEGDIVGKDSNVYEVYWDKLTCRYTLRRAESDNYPSNRSDGYYYYCFNFVDSDSKEHGLKVLGNVFQGIKGV